MIFLIVSKPALILFFYLHSNAFPFLQYSFCFDVYISLLSDTFCSYVFIFVCSLLLSIVLDHIVLHFSTASNFSSGIQKSLNLLYLNDFTQQTQSILYFAGDVRWRSTLYPSKWLVLVWWIELQPYWQEKQLTRLLSVATKILPNSTNR